MYIKAVERAHMPNKWWEKIKLPSNYAKVCALAIQSLEILS